MIEGKFAAIEDGELRFYKVDQGKAGTRWEGFTFLSVQSSGDFFPIKARDRKASILAAISSDPESAARVYGHQLGVCGICGKTLTDEDSRRNGIGPVCAGNVGFSFARGIDTKLDAEAPIVHPVKVVEVPQAEKASAPLVRKVEMGTNKYGPVFLIRFSYDDPKFASLKDEVKGWDWETTKRKWNPVAKAWEVDAKSEVAVATVKHFAIQNEFKLSPEAEAKFEGLASRPAVAEVQEAVEQEINRQTAGLPMTFSDLLKEV